MSAIAKHFPVEDNRPILESTESFSAVVENGESQQAVPSPSRLDHPIFSMIVPVYNEAVSFPKLIAEVEQARLSPFQLFVVYDTPGDTTRPVAEELAATRPWLKLVHNQLGRGPANALRAGFQAAGKGPSLVVMADLSDDLSVVPDLLTLYFDGHHVVCPSRFMPGGQMLAKPGLKPVLARTAGVLLRWFARFPVHDATNNFRLYDAEMVNQLGIRSRFGFEVALELTARAYAAGARVTEVPSCWRDRTDGTSNFRLWKWLPHYLKWYLFAISRQFSRIYRAPRPLNPPSRLVGEVNIQRSTQI
ncbi:MAG: glycosyl transferase family 2 [Planctomyces sp.]|jgi:glycosyltransferase involved in cell wall biosynthesis|nr:glycosyl transferase family 2 [Planctomyces sp.]